MTELPHLQLRRGADKRLRAGHLWVYSNEIDSAATPLAEFVAGQQVAVRDSRGQLLGSAYMEPQSLICARIYLRGEAAPLGAQLIQDRVQQALALRQHCCAGDCYRLVYGDSDFLPGVVVDRFHNYLVLQLNNAAIERCQSDIVAALVALIEPAGILLRADSRARREQGLEATVETVYGEVPQHLPLEENGVRFMAPAWQGQKTGWFYDHCQSRERLRVYAPGAQVLDVYSYVGGWGVQAAAFGAASVCCVDSSETALNEVAGNAALNGVAERVTTRQGSADRVMTQLHEEGVRFDLVILDPPAFIQRRRDLAKGIKAYRRINEMGLRLLKPGGVLVSGSCSMQLPREELVGALASAAVRTGCELQILEQGGQGPDHPVHPAIPETDYLKAVFARKLG